MSKLSTYGPAVLGQKKFEELQRAETGGGSVFGPAVLGHKQPEPEKPQAPSHLSVRALRNILTADPARLDYYMAAEWEREGGPRKGALEFFIEVEGQKPGPRQVVLDRIAEALSE